MFRLAAAAFAILAFTVPTVADAAPEAAPFFVDGPQCASSAVGDADLEEIGVQPPAAKELSCTANQICPNDCRIGCTGSSECLVGSTWVECDGNRIDCPYPTCGEVENCLDNCSYCACIAGGGGYAACHGEYCSGCWPPLACA